jgi:FixJ family two-component response regulator
MTLKQVYVVDDDEAVRDSLRMLMEAVGLDVRPYASAAQFLDAYSPNAPGCLVLDIRMPGMSGLALQDELAKRRLRLPIVFLTGHGDVTMAVRAMKRGAADFIEKPYDEHRLIYAVLNALRSYESQQPRPAASADAAEKLASLSTREREVLDRVLEGKQTRAIAAELFISPKTVEFHRARIREKLGVASLAELFKLFLPGARNGELDEKAGTEDGE